MTDRERLIELLEDTLHEWESDVSVQTLTEIAKHLIENGVIVTEEAEKALDVSEVVRCKNCKNYELMKSGNYHFCNEFGGRVTEKDFCSRAQKMDGGNDNA